MIASLSAVVLGASWTYREAVFGIDLAIPFDVVPADGLSECGDMVVCDHRVVHNASPFKNSKSAGA